MCENLMHPPVHITFTYHSITKQPGIYMYNQSHYAHQLPNYLNYALKHNNGSQWRLHKQFQIREAFLTF